QVLALVDRFHGRDAFADVADGASKHAQALLATIGVDAGQARRFQRLAAALLYPDPALRAAPGVRAKGQGGAPTLWAGGISGDRPIALLHIDDGAGLALVDALLDAGTYWRAHGVDTDIVAVARTRGAHEALQSRFDDWAERNPPPDGKPNLFAFQADEASDALRAGLAAAAAIVLDQRDGDFAAQVDALPDNADVARNAVHARTTT